MTVVYVGAVTAALRAGAAALAIAVCAVALAGAPSRPGRLGRNEPVREHGRVPLVVAGPVVSGRPGAAPRVRPSRPPLVRALEVDQSWAFALPFGTLGLAWVSGNDPAAVYSAIAAVVFALLPLAAFACARACFDWRGRWALASALLLAAGYRAPVRDPLLLAAAAAGTAFVFGAVTALRPSLEPGAVRSNRRSPACSRPPPSPATAWVRAVLRGGDRRRRVRLRVDAAGRARAARDRSRSSSSRSPSSRGPRSRRSRPASATTSRPAASRRPTRTRSHTGRSRRRSA